MFFSSDTASEFRMKLWSTASFTCFANSERIILLIYPSIEISATMRQIFNLISAAILSLSPLAGGAILALVTYNHMPKFTGFIIIGLIVILSFWMGYAIFRRVMLVGPIEVLTASGASPEADHPVPTGKNDFASLTAAEYVEKFDKQEHFCKGGSIRIFNDWLRIPRKELEIKRATYRPEPDLLILRFSGGVELRITAAKRIFEATTYLKIIKAGKIELRIPASEVEKAQEEVVIEYDWTPGKIHTKANSTRHPQAFDVSLGDPALMIYSY